VERSLDKSNIRIGDFYAFEDTLQGDVFFAVGREFAENDE